MGHTFCCAHIPPVLAHAVGGFELHNHLLFVHVCMFCLGGGLEGGDRGVGWGGEQSLHEKKQRGSLGSVEVEVGRVVCSFWVPIWPLCGILRFYDCDLGTSLG